MSITQGPIQRDRQIRIPMAAYLIGALAIIESTEISDMIMAGHDFTPLFIMEIITSILVMALSIALFKRVRTVLLPILMLSISILDIIEIFLIPDPHHTKITLIIMHVVLFTFTSLFLLINTTKLFSALEKYEHTLFNIFKVLFVIWLVVAFIIFFYEMYIEVSEALGGGMQLIDAISPAMTKFVFETGIIGLWAAAHISLEVWINNPYVRHDGENQEH